MTDSFDTNNTFHAEFSRDGTGQKFEYNWITAGNKNITPIVRNSKVSVAGFLSSAMLRIVIGSYLPTFRDNLTENYFTCEGGTD